jgi:hypothetical protein
VLAETHENTYFRDAERTLTYDTTAPTSAPTASPVSQVDPMAPGRYRALFENEYFAAIGDNSMPRHIRGSKHEHERYLVVSETSTPTSAPTSAPVSTDSDGEINSVRKLTDDAAYQIETYMSDDIYDREAKYRKLNEGISTTAPTAAPTSAPAMDMGRKRELVSDYFSVDDMHHKLNEGIDPITYAPTSSPTSAPVLHRMMRTDSTYFTE